MAIATERFSEQKVVQNIDGQWTGTRAFDVINFLNEDDACNSTGVLIGQGHPLDSSLQCVSRALVENKLTKGIVALSYAVTTLVPNDPSPLLRAPFVSWKWTKQSLPIDTDINGNPILNSAFDAFRSNVSRNFSSRILRIERYESSYNQALAQSYTDATNSDVVTLQGNTFQPGQCYLHSYSPVEAYQVGCNYVKVAYEIECRTPNYSGLTAKQIRYPHQPRILDQGLRAQYLDPNNSNAKTLGDFFLANTTQKVGRDVLLNGTGQPTDSTVVVTQNGYSANATTIPGTVLTDTSSTATYLIYMIYPELTFASLGL